MIFMCWKSLLKRVITGDRKQLPLSGEPITPNSGELSLIYDAGLGVERERVAGVVRSAGAQGRLWGSGRPETGE